MSEEELLSLYGESKMGKARMATLPETATAASRIPRLEAGDHLDQATFHERYKAMLPEFRAELIGGVVTVPSPLSRAHDVQTRIQGA